MATPAGVQLAKPMLVYDTNTFSTGGARCFANCKSKFNLELVRKLFFAIAVIATVGVVVGALYMTGNLSFISSSTTVGSAMFYTLIGSSAFLALYTIYQIATHCTAKPTRQATENEVINLALEVNQSGLAAMSQALTNNGYTVNPPAL